MTLFSHSPVDYKKINLVKMILEDGKSQTRLTSDSKNIAKLRKPQRTNGIKREAQSIKTEICCFKERRMKS